MRILLGRHLNAGTRDNRRLRPSFGALLRVPLLLDAPLVFAAPLLIGREEAFFFYQRLIRTSPFTYYM